MKRGKILTIILAMGVVISVVGCGNKAEATSSMKSEENSGEYVVKIGVAQGALCHAPIHVAIENGYFEEEGLKFESVDFGSTAIQEAIGSGQIDAGFGLVGKFIQPLENGLNLKVTSGMHTGCTKLLVKKDSGIHTVADLKGKKIGVNGLASSETVTTKRALAKVGIDFSAENSEVEFLVYSTTDLPVALNNGAVDAIAVADPVATTSEKEYDLEVVINTTTDEDFKDEYCCISFVTTELAEKHPDLAAKFTRAVQKGSAWVEQHPYETAKLQIEKKYVSGDVDLNAEILESYYYNPSVSGGYKALDAVSRELQTIGILKPETDIEAFIKNSFVELEGVPDSVVLEGETFKEIE